MNIYETGRADNLMDPDFYTRAISDYQEAEKTLLLQLVKPFNSLIEAGCAKGRYALAITAIKKNYVGIDIAGHHIADAMRVNPGNRNVIFIHDDIENIDSIFKASGISNTSCLVVFPFNNFGNLRNPEIVLRKLKALAISFIIFTYSTGIISTRERSKYYLESGFHNLNLSDEREGKRFTNADGLNTIAYKRSWFMKIFRTFGFDFRSISFGKIGRAYCNF